jgi:hypothetical protein
MPRPKKQQEPKNNTDNLIEEIYWQEMEYDCPKRGKVKQKVKVKRYRTICATYYGMNIGVDPVSKIEENNVKAIIKEEEQGEGIEPTEE